MHGLFSSVSGGAAHELWLEKVTNNLANVNTAGYKGDYPTFESYFLNGTGNGNIGGEITPSVVLVRVSDGIDMTQGPVKETGNPLDLAIEGEGFFVVDTPEGTRYTRTGTFTLNNEGVLVTQQGFPVMGERGEISLSGKEIVVTEDGSVIVDGRDVDTLRVVDIDDRKNLIKAGDNLFSLTDGGSEVEAEGVSIHQGGVEMSNVNVVSEMTKLINIHRAYESYQKVIHSMDEISSKTINEVGKLR